MMTTTALARPNVTAEPIAEPRAHADALDIAPVLARGACIVAEIHHSHGIKAALAVAHLHHRFPHWTAAFWQDALTQARWFDEPVVAVPIAAAPQNIPPARGRLLLARSVVPLAYAAVRSWADVAGADDIVRFYTEQATAKPEYLGHRLSILLALGEAWPLYEQGPHRALYLDRLTEFLLACRFSSTDDVDPGAPTATWEEACTAALTHPGFFGHNLIGLAWIGRSRSKLSEVQLQRSCGWAVASATTPDDEEENPMPMLPAAEQALTEPALDAGLQELLLQGVRNVHLLTLADAIAWLWDALDHPARPCLLNIAKHHMTRQTQPDTPSA